MRPDLPPMKRFWLFAGDNFYPYGGMEDFAGDFDTAEAAAAAGAAGLAKRAHEPGSIDWFHVLDTERREVVAEG
jgi:hypothetical protein